MSDSKAIKLTARPTHRVAIVVFMEGQGDLVDVESGARRAIQQALSAAKIGDTGRFGECCIPVGDPDSDGETFEVHRVLEVGSAMTNGYLWPVVTGKAFPRPGERRGPN
jgi:hypothetical protein